MARAALWLLWLLAAELEQPGQGSVLWPWLAAASCTIADTSAGSVLLSSSFSDSSRDLSQSQHRVLCCQAASVTLGHYRESGFLLVNQL